MKSSIGLRSATHDILFKTFCASDFKFEKRGTSMSSFESFNIHKGLLEKLNKMNIHNPTAVQHDAIPVLLSGEDAVVQSQTGTGKTLAYLLPVLEKLDTGSKELQAVIVTPTQELGAQIYQDILALSTDIGIRSASLIGGAAVKRQLEKLKSHPHIVVGTPGRLVELIHAKKLKMHFVQSIVVDEVDQVFALGSVQDVERIIKSTLKSRQLVFISATITEEIKLKAEEWMKQPKWIHIKPEQKVATGLENHYIVVQERDKLDVLKRMLLTLKPKKAIIFVSETERIAEWVAKLRYNGVDVDAIYGEAGKQERAEVMKRFRDGKLQLLLSTDLAARGLDIEDITHVFNFDPPLNVDYYVHRAGRTGRMGRSGHVISLVTPKELFIMKKYAKQLGVSIEEKIWHQGRLASQDHASKSAGGRGADAVNKTKKNSAKASDSTYQNEVKPVVSKQGATKPQANSTSQKTPSRQKSERHRDRKNKGAPKWHKK